MSAPCLCVQSGLDVLTLNQWKFVLHVVPNISVNRLANPIGSIHFQSVANGVYAVYHFGI
jgi:hypothetical protein